LNVEHRALAFQQYEVRAALDQPLDEFGGQSHTDIFGRILNRTRQCGLIHHSGKELRVKALLQTTLWGRLQDHPARALLRSPVGEMRLRLDSGLGNGHRDRHPAGHLFRDELHQYAPLVLCKLADFRSEPEHCDTMSAILHARPHLSTHRMVIETAVGAEERIHHRIDPAEAGRGP